MSGKRNPLGRLLRLREIREKTARIELARAQQSEQQAAEREAAARAAENDYIRPLDIMRPGQLRAMQLMGVRLFEIREAAAADHDEAQRRLSARIDSWRRASVELEGAEALEEKRSRAAAAVARSAAERALDDLQIMQRRKEAAR